MSARTQFSMADPDVNGYALLTAIVVPRPIAWVSSLDSEGRGNLAPHSFFNVASADPPTIMFTSVGEKDTLRNVRATGEFVVSLAAEHQLDDVNDSSAPFEPGADEAGALGIAMVPSHTVSPPRVRDSPAALECRVHEIVPVGTCSVVLGTVLLADVDTAVLDGAHPRFELLRPLSRLGRNEWGRAPKSFALDRPRRVDDVSSR